MKEITMLAKTLPQMFIVNAGHGFKLLWNTVKGWFDPKTSAKRPMFPQLYILMINSFYYAHVLGNKYQARLLEAIDASQLPDFLGGLCTCSDEGGCLRSNRGPWNDPVIMKLARHVEAASVRKISAMTDGEKIDFYPRLRPLKGRNNDTSAESGSYVDDLGSPVLSRNIEYSRLAPVHEEVRASEYASYYSCDVQFIIIDKAVDSCRRQTRSSVNTSVELKDQRWSHTNGPLHSLEHLQKLEVVLSELRNKPVEIPMEIEQMLQESWDRIKSIEVDLNKTKKVPESFIWITYFLMSEIGSETC